MSSKNDTIIEKQPLTDEGQENLQNGSISEP